jgi:hypothetical protein
MKHGRGVGGVLDNDGFDDEPVVVSDAKLCLNCILIDYAAYLFSEKTHEASA